MSECKFCNGGRIHGAVRLKRIRMRLQAMHVREAGVNEDAKLIVEELIETVDKMTQIISELNER